MLKFCSTQYDPKEKIWSGRRVPKILNTDVSIGQVVLRVMELNLNKIAQISDNNGIQFTNKEMALMTIRIAQNLQKTGLKQGDVVGIMGSNTHFITPLAFGAFLCGTPISALDPTFDNVQTKHIISMTEPKIFFCDGSAYATAKKTIDDLGIVCPIYTLKDHIAGVGKIEEFLKETGCESSFIPPKLEKGGDQTALIQCSSGTTGLSKGICVSHRNLLELMIEIYNEDIVLNTSSFYWISAFFVLVNCALCAATRVITDEVGTGDLVLKLIEKYKVTKLMSSPFLMGMMVQSNDIKIRDLSSLRLYMCGGNIVSTTISQEMQKYLKNGIIVTLYGLTESGIVSSESAEERKQGSAGKLLSNIEVKIIDDNGSSLGVGEKGEICVRTQCKWAGYYGNPKATAEVYDEDEWVHTGDLGCFDKDGFIFVIERNNRVIKYKNFRIIPTEIEQEIIKIPDVADVCVCGIPDLNDGEILAAFVVKKTGSTLNEAQVSRYVSERMVNYKHLRGGIYFVEYLPKSPAGKTQHFKVKNLVRKIQNVG